MRTTFAASALLAVVPLASAAFSNTYSLLAWSDSSSSNLESFRPHAAKASLAYQLEQASSAGEECYPALVVSAPSFSHDDLALLPAHSKIRREWTEAAASMHLPFVSQGSVDNLRMMVDRRFGGCETPTVFRKAKAFVKSAGDSRAQWVQELDRMIEDNLEQLPSDRIVILSSVPDLGSHYRRKRQISKEAWSELESSTSSSSSSDIGIDAPVDADSSTTTKSVFAQGYAGNLAASKANGNSTIDSNAGQLHRYTFTSPALIFGSLVFILILIPAVLLSVNALTSIERLQGLETKMQGGQLGESKKDQ